MAPTEFEEKVYAFVREHSAPGQVHTYGAVAAHIGAPNSARAVGNALKKNPFGPDSGCDANQVVNCHRVVPQTRKVGGYFGDSSNAGTDKKRARLEAEGVVFDESGRVCLECVKK